MACAGRLLSELVPAKLPTEFGAADGDADMENAKNGTHQTLLTEDGAVAAVRRRFTVGDGVWGAVVWHR